MADHNEDLMDEDTIEQWLADHPDVQKFEDLKITTMTLIVRLDGEIEKFNAFALLPWTKVDAPIQKKKTAKCKLPQYEHPGHIISIRNGPLTRGLIRSNKTTYFKNNVTLDISTSHGNVSVKLSGQTLQMCGAKSVEVGREAATYIINHLNRIQGFTNYIRDNQEEAINTYNWVLENCKGEMEVRDQSVVYTAQNGVQFTMVSKVEDYLLNREISVSDAPHPELAAFFLEQMVDFVYHSDFSSKLQWIITGPDVVKSQLEIHEIEVAMANCNYNLGYEIDRYEFMRVFNGYDGFFARYDNTKDHTVSLERKCTTAPTRRGKTARHSFLVYRSGIVTQSGRNNAESRDVYYRFMMIVHQYRHLFEDTDDVQVGTPGRKGLQSSVSDLSMGSPGFLSSPGEDSF